MLPKGEILLYQTEDGDTKIDVRMEDDTVWLTQEQMSELFQTTKSNISMHISNIFEEGELRQEEVMRKFRISEFSTKPTYFYNLDIVISVGYRVKSPRGTQFRIWASKVLREYLIKGFTMNDELLKQAGGGGYFDELLERIRDIRSSEKVFWRKVLDIYATSIDYDPRSDSSQIFFKTVQNKMHWAAHGHTAAEKVFYSVDANKPNLGMTHFVGKRPTQTEAMVAKNYCNEEELASLNSTVSAYLEFAEMQARRHIPMYMSDWIETLDGFLKLSRHDILQGAGKISAEMAKTKVKEEFTKYKSIHSGDLTVVDRDYIAALETAEQGLSDINN
nr:virulence RhuM family protein [Pseudoflavonifractor phocaeensis]